MAAGAATTTAVRSRILCLAQQSDAKAKSLLTQAKGPLKVAANHMVAEACPMGWPAPVAGKVGVSQHELEYLSFKNIIIADDPERTNVRSHIKDT